MIQALEPNKDLASDFVSLMFPRDDFLARGWKLTMACKHLAERLCGITTTAACSSNREKTSIGAAEFGKTSATWLASIEDGK